MRLGCSVAIFTIYWNFVKFLTHRRLMAPRPQIMTSVCRILNKVDIPLFFKIYFRFSKQSWFFYRSFRLRDRVMPPVDRRGFSCYIFILAFRVFRLLYYLKSVILFPRILVYTQRLTRKSNTRHDGKKIDCAEATKKGTMLYTIA